MTGGFLLPSNSSHSYISLDVRVRIVTNECEVLIGEGEDAFNLLVDLHHRQRMRLPAQLEPRLIKVVQVEVGVTASPDEFPRLIPAHLSHHHGQQSVGGDVEREAQEHISTALIELAGQLAVGDVELEQTVAGR